MRPLGKQRGPMLWTRQNYERAPAHQFIKKIIDTGKYAEVWNHETGRGIFIGIYEARSKDTESGRIVQIVMCEIWRCDFSKCCNDVATVKSSDEGTSYYVCSKCGEACDIYLRSIRKPTYINNPRKNMKREKQWHQTTVPIELAREVGEALLGLLGDKKHEAAVKKVTQMAEEVREDRRETKLQKYDI